MIFQFLFVYFGARLLKDSYEMSGDGPSEELQEVEEEFLKKKAEEREEDDTADELELGKTRKQHKKKNFCFGGDNLKVFTQVSFLNSHFIRCIASKFFVIVDP